MSTPVSTFEHPQRLAPGFHLPARMSVFTLMGGRLALVSPVPIDASSAARIAALGEVAYLIAPNLLHHLYLGDAVGRYPRAQVLAPRGLRSKRPDVRVDRALEDGLPAELAQELTCVQWEGAPTLDEFVFFQESTRTLVVTDLVFNVTEPRGVLTHAVLFMVGCHGKLAQSRAVRMTVKDTARARASAERICALPCARLVMAHGDVVERDGQARLAFALRGLLPTRVALPSEGVSR